MEINIREIVDYDEKHIDFINEVSLTKEWCDLCKMYDSKEFALIEEWNPGAKELLKDGDIHNFKIPCVYEYKSDKTTIYNGVSKNDKIIILENGYKTIMPKWYVCDARMQNIIEEMAKGSKFYYISYQDRKDISKI